MLSVPGRNTLMSPYRFLPRALVPKGLGGRLSLSLAALFAPGALFALGLFLLRDQPRFHWLRDLRAYPAEFWLIALGGISATVAGVLDWAYHRSGKAAIGGAEHRSELLALGCGGLPLFVLMAAASLVQRPGVLLLPVLVCVLATTVMICYDEFVFHRKRCGSYETLLHRLLVFGNGAAWLAWMNWCFVRGGNYG
jgi:hypothetical protein